MPCFSLRGGWVALALFLSPQFAPAGPIAWSYTAAPVPGGGAEFYLGSFPFDAATGRETLYGFAPFPESIAGDGLGSQERIPVGSLTKQSFSLLTPPPGAAVDPVGSNTVRFQFRLTDTASGDAGAVAFFLKASLITALPESRYSELVLSGSGGGSLQLGGNAYDVRLYTGETESNVWVLADVSVVATPEPGTITLTGFGLGMAALRLRRRLRVV